MTTRSSEHITDDDIRLDALEFDIPCEHVDCENDATWIRRCRKCGDLTFYCTGHRTDFEKRLASLGMHVLSVGCTNCLGTAPTFDKLMTWIPIRGTD